MGGNPGPGLAVSTGSEEYDDDIYEEWYECNKWDDEFDENDTQMDDGDRMNKHKNEMQKPRETTKVTWGSARWWPVTGARHSPDGAAGVPAFHLTDTSEL